MAKKTILVVRRVCVLFSLLMLCAAMASAGSVFLVDDPSADRSQEAPHFHFDGPLFESSATHLATGSTIEGLPIPGYEQRTFRIIDSNNSLTSQGTRIEIVEEHGSRFVDMPRINQLIAESDTNPGDRVGLYEIGGKYFGTALVDGVMHELVPAEDSNRSAMDLYQFRQPDPSMAPAPGWCSTESTQESIDAQIAAEAAARESGIEPQRGARIAAIADREVDFAIECSYEYTSKFPDVETAAHYMLAIMAEVNNIYIRDIQLQFRITHFRLWNIPADPYDGASSFDYLGDLMGQVFAPGTPAAMTNADLIHLFTADEILGGVANLNTACFPGNTKTGFSDVYTTAQYPFTGYTWSVDVTSHEVGHNLGSNHTHCYFPPIDKCWGVESGCFSGSFVRSEGSILSYCHLSSTTRLEFHPRVITVLRSNVLGFSCLATVPTSPTDIYEDDNTFDVASPLGEQNEQPHSIFPVGDVDWATINLTQWTGVTIQTEGASGDTVLTLLDQSMNVLASSDDIDGVNLFSRIESDCVTAPLSPGRYYVRVEEKGNDATIADYRLGIEADYCFEDGYEPDDTYAQATTIELGTVQERSILPEGDADLVKFTLPSPTTFTAHIEGPQYIWYQMFLYDSTFAQIDDGYGDASTCTLTRNCSSAPTPAGTYYLRIIQTGNNKTGNYKLHLYPCTPKVLVANGAIYVLDGSGPIDFGSVQPGFAQLERTFRVRNLGAQPLTLSGLSVPAEYSILEGLSASIPSGGMDDFTVALPPTTTGVHAGTISFVTNDPGALLFNFTVTGEVIAQSPEVAVSLGVAELLSGGAAVDFGMKAVGEPASSRTFTVRNTGALALSTSNLAASGGFAITESLDAVIPASTSGSETVSASPELNIGGGQLVQSYPVVFSNSGPISDVTVTVNVTTSWTGALLINLSHPDGSFVTLFPNNAGGSGDNLIDTTFSDSGATGIAAGTPPFSGVFRPSTPLSTFDGKNAAGTWTLFFYDPTSLAQDKVVHNYSVTVHTATTGQDTFTVQLPTGTPGDFTGAVSFDTNDGDENPFTIPMTGSVGQWPTLTSFALAGGAAALSTNPVPFAFTEAGTFPATSIEVSETSNFASYQSIPVPAGPYAYNFTSSISGTRTLYARLRNAVGPGNALSDSTILDNTPPVATINPMTLVNVEVPAFFHNPYTATDAHSGVKEIDVWVLPPGGAWQYAFTQNPPTGNFFYTPTDGPGMYVIDVVGRDNAGNSSPLPSSTQNKHFTLFSPLQNGPFPHYFPSPVSGPLTFAMENQSTVTINFADAPTSGVLTLQRIENNTNAAGLDPQHLIGEHWIITESGGFDFTTAEIMFRYDEALLSGLDEATELNTAYRVTGATYTALPATVDINSNRVTVSGVTGFSDWYIGDPMPVSGLEGDWMLLE